MDATTELRMGKIDLGRRRLSCLRDSQYSCAISHIEIVPGSGYSDKDRSAFLLSVPLSNCSPRQYKLNVWTTRRHLVLSHMLGLKPIADVVK